MVQAGQGGAKLAYVDAGVGTDVTLFCVTPHFEPASDWRVLLARLIQKRGHR